MICRSNCDANKKLSEVKRAKNHLEKHLVCSRRQVFSLFIKITIQDFFTP